MNMGKLKEWVNDNCPGEDCPGCGSPVCYAVGGKVEPIIDDSGNMDSDGDHDGDSSADDELADMACSELLSAIEKKDKKEILEAIRAIVLSVR